MTASFVAYIDESGDEGFIFRPDSCNSGNGSMNAAPIKKQALSSRIPPVRAVAVTSNLYKSHACLHCCYSLTLEKCHQLC